MSDIAKLLFGDEAAAGLLSGLFGPYRDSNGFGMAEVVRRSGEWCASTPGRGTPRGQVADALCRTRSPRAAITIRF